MLVFLLFISALIWLSSLGVEVCYRNGMHNIALHLKTNTNPSPDPNRYRRHCPDPNARIQKFIHYMAIAAICNSGLSPVEILLCVGILWNSGSRNVTCTWVRDGCITWGMCIVENGCFFPCVFQLLRRCQPRSLLVTLRSTRVEIPCFSCFNDTAVSPSVTYWATTALL